MCKEEKRKDSKLKLSIETFDFIELCEDDIEPAEAERRKRFTIRKSFLSHMPVYKGVYLVLSKKQYFHYHRVCKKPVLYNYETYLERLYIIYPFETIFPGESKESKMYSDFQKTRASYTNLLDIMKDYDSSSVSRIDVNDVLRKLEKDS